MIFAKGLSPISDLAHISTNQTDVLEQYLVRFDSNVFSIGIKFYGNFDSTAAHMPVKFHTYTIIKIYNLVPSNLCDIWK